jgi:ribonuclease HI
MTKLTVFTDGASRGNPGPASYGFTISDEKGLVYEEGKYIGITTNNVAEYTGALEAFKYIDSHFAGKDVEIKFFADSKLVAEQLAGKWQIKSPGLIPIYQQIKILQEKFSKVTFSHVYREQNKIADALANLALDNR